MVRNLILLKVNIFGCMHHFHQKEKNYWMTKLKTIQSPSSLFYLFFIKKLNWWQTRRSIYGFKFPLWLMRSVTTGPSENSTFSHFAISPRSSLGPPGNFLWLKI